MGYQRFEDIPVWKDGVELAVRLVRITQTGRLNGVGDLKNQAERAAISISNNIAEGYERGTSEELISTALSQCKELTQSFPPTGLASNKRSRITSPIVWSQILISQKVAALHTYRLGAGVITFLYFSRGSTGEVRSMLHLIGRLPLFQELASEIDDLRIRTESISRQLGGWIEAIKNSSYKGHRSQNDRTRAAAEAVKRRDQFLERVREVQDEAIRRQRSSPGGEPGRE